MKKLIAITLCAVMALSFAACSNNSPSKDNPPKQASGKNDQIANSYIDCKTIADAEKLAGFTVLIPNNIPSGYSQDSIQAEKDGLVKIIYINGHNQLTFRQSKGSGDISGDHNEYAEKSTLTIGSLQVSIRGNDEKVNSATWTDGEFAFAISVNPGGVGLDSTAISDMISSVKPDVDGDDEIPSPFVNCDTMPDAEKIAGFNVAVPEKMPEGYTQKLIQVIEKEMVQVFYVNGDKQILIRKAKGNENISGDYNEYKENNTVTVGSLKVSTRGNDGKVNAATWADGEYTYSITANLGETGLEAATINDMVGSIR